MVGLLLFISVIKKEIKLFIIVVKYLPNGLTRHLKIQAIALFIVERIKAGESDEVENDVLIFEFGY